jgi:ABC-type sugar transport system substrate-binding protein
MPERFRIGVWIQLVDPYWVQIRKAVSQLSLTLPVDLIFLDNISVEENSLADQERFIEDLLARELSVIIATYIPENIALRLLRLGLSVVHLSEASFDHPRMVKNQGYFNSACIAGKFLAEKLHGQGTLLVVGGGWAKRGEDGNTRLAGIQNTLSRLPKIQIQHISTPWEYEPVCSILTNALAGSQIHFDGVFGLSDPLVLAANDVARILGLSPRQVRDLLAGWVDAGWLVIGDPARKSRRYRLSAEYRRFIGGISAN